jgi:hypothetical protein
MREGPVQSVLLHLSVSVAQTYDTGSSWRRNAAWHAVPGVKISHHVSRSLTYEGGLEEKGDSEEKQAWRDKRQLNNDSLWG